MCKQNIKLLFLSFICLITFSCTFQDISIKEIAFSLPRTATNLEEPIPIVKVVLSQEKTEFVYNVKPEVVKDKKNIYKIAISDIPTGTYKLTVNWEDYNFKYSGETKVSIEQNKTSTVKFDNITKTPIKISSIKVEPINVLLNETVTIDNFTSITEILTNGKERIVSNKKYEIVSQKIDTSKLGPTSVTIRNKEDKTIQANVTVNVKFDLPSPTISVNEGKNNILVPQYDGVHTLNATISKAEPNEDPNKDNKTTINWYISDSENGDYIKLNQDVTTIDIPNGDINTKYYKAEVIVTPSEKNKDHCSSSQKTAITGPIKVSIKPWKLSIKEATTEDNGVVTLPSGKPFTLTLTNEATEVAMSVIWKSTIKSLTIQNGTFTTPSVTSEQSGTISAVIKDGVSTETTVASINVKIAPSTLSSITATQVQDKNIFYDSTVTIDNFTITEQYSDGKQYTGTNSNYRLASTIDTKTLGNKTVSIERTDNSAIKTEVTVHVVYALPSFKVNITGDKNTTIAQFTSNKTLSFTTTPAIPTTYPNDKNIKTIEWLQCNTENGSYTTIPGQTGESFTVPNDTEGQKYYKARITLTPDSSRKTDCIDPQKQYESNVMGIKVAKWNIELSGNPTIDNLKGKTSYTLSLKNEAGGSVPSVTWTSTNSQFKISGSQLTTPALNVDLAQSSKLSAVINKDSADEKVIAEIEVKVSAKTLSSITATAKNNKYVLYNNNLNINDFTITEKYSDNSTAELSNNSEYEFTTTGPIKTVGTTNVTIRKISTPSITCNTTIPCKYNLKAFTLQINESGTPQGIAVPQFTGSEKLKAIISPASFTAPNDTDIVTYQWQECGTKDGSYTPISGATSHNYSVPVDATGQKYYKCVAIVKPSPSNAKFCLDESKPATSTNTIDITVKPWNLAITKGTAGDDGKVLLENGIPYDLALTNEVQGSNPGSVTYESDSTAFDVNGTKVTPTAGDKELTGKISAVYKKGTAEEKELATVNVKVAKKALSSITVTDFNSLKTAINNGIPEIIIDTTTNIDFSSTLTINKDVKITAKQNVLMKRNATFSGSFFIIDANATFGDETSMITLFGDSKGEASLIKVNNGKTLIMNLCCLEGNKSGTQDGGAINNAGNCTLNKCTVRDNTSDGNGGGVMNTAGSLEVIQTTFGKIEDATKINLAKNGGAIAVTGGTVNIDSLSNICNNTATSKGGGLWIDGGTVTSSGNIANNASNEFIGWNVYVSANGGTYNGTPGEHIIDE